MYRSKMYKDNFPAQQTHWEEPATGLTRVPLIKVLCILAPR